MVKERDGKTLIISHLLYYLSIYTNQRLVRLFHKPRQPHRVFLLARGQWNGIEQSVYVVNDDGQLTSPIYESPPSDSASGNTAR